MNLYIYKINLVDINFLFNLMIIFLSFIFIIIIIN